MLSEIDTEHSVLCYLQESEADLFLQKYLVLSHNLHKAYLLN